MAKYQLPHQPSWSSKLRPCVMSLLDINWPLQTRLKGRNTDYFSVGLCHHTHSISADTGSTNLSWKLRYPAVRTGLLDSQRSRRLLSKVARAWGLLNAVMWICIGEKCCEYTSQVSLGNTWIFIIGLLLHWSCDLNNWFLKHFRRNTDAKQRQSLLIRINKNFLIFKQ